MGVTLVKISLFANSSQMIGPKGLKYAGLMRVTLGGYKEVW